MSLRNFSVLCRTSVLAAVLSMVADAGLAVEPAASAASAPTSASLMAPIQSLIGDAPCDNQGQCHAVGIGAKPCGGPSGYLPWSDQTTDPSALKAAVQAQARAQGEENKKRGMASDCMISPEPTAVCRPRAGDGKKVCELGQGGVRSPV